jgi:hypothetical protein
MTHASFLSTACADHRGERGKDSGIPTHQWQQVPTKTFSLLAPCHVLGGLREICHVLGGLREIVASILQFSP